MEPTVEYYVNLVLKKSDYTAEHKLFFWWAITSEQWYRENDRDYVDGFWLTFDEIEERLGIYMERLNHLVNECTNMGLIKAENNYPYDVKITVMDFYYKNKPKIPSYD
jgi:hypothetical protein